MVLFVWLLLRVISTRFLRLRNPVGIAHMWIIFYLTKLTHSRQRSSGIGFVCRTPVTRIFFIKLNPSIGSNVGVGTNGMTRNRPQLSCYFLDCWDIWGAVGLSMSLRNKLWFRLVFITNFSTHIYWVQEHYSYSMHVLTPVNLAEAQSNMAEYAVSGFPGCVGSSDCTHITTEGCEYNLKNNHLGGKSSHTTHTFNLMCNHRHKYYTNTTYHTRRSRSLEWYDYGKVWYILTDVRAGRILTDNEFELLSYNKEGNVISVWYNGVYVIVDNGYLAWSCTVPPIFVTNKIDETRWSRWVESMRKDVECTFGILMGRMENYKDGRSRLRRWQGWWDLAWAIGMVNWDRWTSMVYVNPFPIQYRDSVLTSTLAITIYQTWDPEKT